MIEILEKVPEIGVFGVSMSLGGGRVNPLGVLYAVLRMCVAIQYLAGAYRPYHAESRQRPVRFGLALSAYSINFLASHFHTGRDLLWFRLRQLLLRCTYQTTINHTTHDRILAS